MPREKSDLGELQDEVTIHKTRGRDTGAPVFWVDGLGVAAVQDAEHISEVAKDLKAVMKAENLPTGSLLLSSRFIDAAGAIHKFARSGISVRDYQGENLSEAAENLLQQFWARRRVVRRQLLNF